MIPTNAHIFYYQQASAMYQAPENCAEAAIGIVSARLRRAISPCQAVGCIDKEPPVNSLDPTGRQASVLEISAGVVLGLGAQVHPTSKRRLTA